MCHNIFTISLYLYYTYNVNLYYRHTKLANAEHICKMCTIFAIFLQICIVFATFCVSTFYVVSLLEGEKKKKEEEEQSTILLNLMLLRLQYF